MKKTAILLILAMIISLFPALSVSAADEYYLKGVYDGAVVVVQQEPEKTVTLVDAANENLISNGATNVAKVGFTFNGGITVFDDSAPYQYLMEFEYVGQQTLTYEVYKTGNETDIPDESKSIVFNTVAGVKNSASFEADFDAPELASASQATLAKTIINNDGENYTSDVLALSIVNGALKVDNTAAKTSGIVQFRGSDINTGHKVHYYEFDYSCPVTAYDNSIFTRVGFNAGDKDALINTNKNTLAGSQLAFPANVAKKIGIVIDYNYETGKAPIVSIYYEGEAWKIVPLTNFASKTTNSTNFLNMGVHYGKDYMLIDNFKYAVYDIKAASSFTGASIAGGYNKPVVTTLPEIRFSGADYLDGQNIADYVTISERANGSTGDFTESSISFVADIDDKDVVISCEHANNFAILLQ